MKKSSNSNFVKRNFILISMTGQIQIKRSFLASSTKEFFRIVEIKGS